MKLLEYFDAFLRDTVNLNQSRLDTLDARVDALVVAVGNDSDVGPLLVDHIPQGSWAHRTIIKPLPHHEFDADVLLHLEEQPDWRPTQYIDELYGVFSDSGLYADKAERKRRCVRINYANECHVDLVPYLVRGDGSQVIVNRQADAFEPTNPEGFTRWMAEADSSSQHNLRKVIRLLKYVRDYRETFDCPSVILTTLLGQRVSPWDPERYVDVPTALVSLLEDLDRWLQLHSTMPLIEDPSCPGMDFNHRWSEERYRRFKARVGIYAEWARSALDEPGRDESVEAWRRIFGDAFKAPPGQSAAAAATKTARVPRARAPREEYIEEKGFSRDLSYNATIEGVALDPRRSIRRVGELHKGLQLEFVAHTDAPEPFDLYWKVRNYGSEAEAVGQLRGEIDRDDGRTRRRKESTRYTGAHYVECYIVKGRRVVAAARHEVVIT